MLNAYYNLSPHLKEMLLTIETLRSSLLLRPLQPKIILRMRWEAMVSRIFYSMKLCHIEVSEKDIIRYLSYQIKESYMSKQSQKKLSQTAHIVINFKKGSDYISQEWIASPKKITPKTIFNLQPFATSPGSTASESDLSQFLDYLAVKEDHPVVQAAIAQIQILYIAPFTTGNDRLSYLVSQLFLYKYGYDFRGFLAQEQSYLKTLPDYNEALNFAFKSNNVTRWLEYFARSMITQLEKVERDILSSTFKTDLPASFWELTERQRGILTLLDQPGSSITNRKVQSVFGISQITSSRDLAKLTLLRLLFSHGKGRSIYYTKV